MSLANNPMQEGPVRKWWKFTFQRTWMERMPRIEKLHTPVSTWKVEYRPSQLHFAYVSKKRYHFFYLTWS